MTIETVEIVIAGGGIAGLAAAAAFRAEGFAVRLVDPAPALPPSPKAQAEGDLRSTALLMPSVALLRRAGVWDALAPDAAPLAVMRLLDAGGPDGGIRTTADFRAEELGQPVFGYNLLNRCIRAALLPPLIAAGIIGPPARVTGFTPRLSEAILRLDDGSRIAARLVIAADGRDSALRRAAGIPARRWSYGQKALVFTVAHDRPHDGVSTEIHRTGGPFTLVPLPDDGRGPASAVVWMERAAEADRLHALPVPAFERALNARACGVLGRLSLSSPRRVWPIISQIADRLTGPRLALVAEAAHVVPPIGAQGLNTSLRDIACLRDLVVAARDRGQDIAAPALLDRYARARHPDALMRVAGVDALNRAAMAETPAFRDLRNLGLNLLHGVRPIRRGAMRLGLGARPAPA